jgi:hypothetical protein
MVEDADLPAWMSGHSVKKFRCNSLDPVPQVQKLSFSFSRQHASGAGKVIYRHAADLAVDDLGLVIHHGEFERHPADVVTYCPAPPERHRTSLTPGFAKLRQFDNRRAVIGEVGDRASQSF